MTETGDLDDWSGGLKVSEREGAEDHLEEPIKAQCPNGHDLTEGFGGGHWTCNICGKKRRGHGSSWRCTMDQRNGIGNCNFDICSDCTNKFSPKEINIIGNGQAKMDDLVQRIGNEYEMSGEFQQGVTALPVEMVSVITRGGDGNTLLQECVRLDRKEHARLLLQHGVPVEQSALAKAVNKDTAEMFELLAEFIEDPDELNFFQLARLLQHEEASTVSDRFKELLQSISEEKNRARIGFLDNCNLVQYAARQGKAGHLRCLLDSGFDPAAVTEHEKRTAIMLAAENGHEEVFSMIAPLMKDLVVLKESTEALNRSRVDRLFHMMFSREDNDSLIEKFRSLVATVPVELVSSHECNAVWFGVYTKQPLLKHCVDSTKKEHARILLQQGVIPDKETIHRAFNRAYPEMFDILAEFIEDPAKLKFLRLAKLLETEEAEEAASDEFKALLESIQEPGEATVSMESFLDNCNLVQYAARQGKAGHLRCLLDSGFDPVAVTEHEKKFAIILAAEKGRMDAISMLAPLMEGSEALEESKDKINLAKIRALFIAIAVLNLQEEEPSPSEKFKSYLTSVPVELVNSSASSIRNSDNRSLLQECSYRGMAKHVRLLLDHGVDPAAVPDGNQRTAIELAADYCHVEVFEMLAPLMEGTEALKKSSNVLNSAKIRAMYDMIDNTDSPSEEFKEYLSSVPVELLSSSALELRELFGHGYSINLLENCVYERKVEHACLLLLQGVNPSQPNNKSLEMAIEKDNLVMVGALGGFMEIPFDLHMKALALFIHDEEKVNPKFTRLLARLPVTEDANKPEEASRCTLVQLAAKKGRSERLQQLLDHGLDATSTSEEEPETAIELAAVLGHSEATSILAPFMEGTLALKVVQLLSQESEDSTDHFRNVLSSVTAAEVNTRPVGNGTTLLQTLAKDGRAALVRLLLQHGVDPNSRRSTEQDTPMELATYYDHMEVVLALGDYTDIPEKTKKSNSWLLMQIEKQASEIRQLRDEMGAVRELLSTVLKEAK